MMETGLEARLPECELYSAHTHVLSTFLPIIKKTEIVIIADKLISTVDLVYK